MYTQPHDHVCVLLVPPPLRLSHEDIPGSDGSMIFVRSNNASRPVVASVAFRAGKGPREASSGRTGDAVGDQSIASSSSSSRSRGRISASRDCDAGIREDADGAPCGGGEDEDNDGWEKVAGLREAWPKTGPEACHVRRGIGAEERERLSSSVGGSRL